jgi:hypothetical protein
MANLKASSRLVFPALFAPTSTVRSSNATSMFVKERKSATRIAISLTPLDLGVLAAAFDPWAGLGPDFASVTVFLAGFNFNVGMGSPNGAEVRNHLKLAEDIYIIGKTGTGKSTLIETMVLQDIERRLGLALIDAHGDLVQLSERTGLISLQPPIQGILRRVPRIMESKLSLACTSGTGRGSGAPQRAVEVIYLNAAGRHTGVDSVSPSGTRKPDVSNPSSRAGPAVCSGPRGGIATWV